MLRHSLQVIPIYVALVLFSFSMPGFCAQKELTEMQKQARIYRDQGWQFQKEGNLDTALSCYQKALLVDPDYPVAYNDAGVILEARGQLERAKQMYLKAIQIAPNYPNSYSNLALLYENQGDYANAIVCWIKRAILGSPQDPWAEAARKRLEDIARIYPEAYRKIGNQYKESLQQLSTGQSSLSEFGFLQPQKSPNISLFSEDNAVTSNSQSLDNKSRALNYLARAKESFSRGEYVAALKEATLAEYLDSSNEEISAFVEKVRRALLQ